MRHDDGGSQVLIAKGGKNIYGFKVGVIMLETHFPRLPGDIGNALTWDFPVLYKTVKGTSAQKIIVNDPEPFLQKFIDTALELQNNGVRLVTTSCGFLSPFQDRVASALSVPFVSSALILVPLIQKMIGPSRKVGIITANSEALSERHFESVGVFGKNVVKVGIEDTEFGKALLYDKWEIDVELAKREMVEKARILSSDPLIGAIVLECTNMPPFSKDIKSATGLPVFDIVSLINFVYSAADSDILINLR
ncbi:MAG: aspartate/glutamate racemase family protein [Pseudothermotoga sp.]